MRIVRGAWIVVAFYLCGPGPVRDLAADDMPRQTKPAAASLDDELFKDLGGELTPGGSKPSAATDAKPQPDATKPRATSAPPAATGDGAKPATARTPPKLSPLDAELMRKLDGDAPEERRTPPPSQSAEGSSDGPSNDPVERLSRMIREAEARLRTADSGSETQRMQGEIVAGLDQLIAQIEQQRQQRQSSGKSSQPSSSQPKPQPGQPQPSPGGKPGERPSDDARDSSEGMRRPDARKADPAKLKEMLAKVWGTLPERDRQDILQTSFEDLPAKYQFVIEEYFKRLIERRE